MDKNYLIGNPWSGIAVPRSAQPRMNPGRSFSQAQWEFIDEQVKLQPDRSTSQRLRFALSLLYAAGVAVVRSGGGKVDELQWVEYPPDTEDAEHVESWLLNVVGTRQRLCKVPVPVDVVVQLADYLVARGFDPDPEAGVNKAAHLLGKATDLDKVAPSLQARNGDDPSRASQPTRCMTSSSGFLMNARGCGVAAGGQGGRAVQAGQHALAAAHPCIACDRAWHSGADRKGDPGSLVVGHDDDLRTTEDKRRMKAMANFWGGK